MSSEKPCACPCGTKPIVDSDSVTGMWVIECIKCGRAVAAKGRAEVFRMWTCAMVYLQDKKSE